MKPFKIIFLLAFIIHISSCAQRSGFGEAYQFSLFNNTPNEKLAEAVKNEEVETIKRLAESGKYDLNFQEPRFGRTLLMLAVGNDKLNSVKALLKEKADVNKRDSFNLSPILEATKYIPLKKNTAGILKELIKYGANVNDTSFNRRDNDTLSMTVPLSEATSNLLCTKILIDNGANIYFRNENIYMVWYELFFNGFENILVARYLIVDKKFPIPSPIEGGVKGRSPDIFSLLSKINVGTDSASQKAAQDILEYLKKIDFPNNQVYHQGHVK